jgi:hypothetical protein
MLFDARLPERFWSRVAAEPNSGCWLWVGAIANTGYGTYAVSGPPPSYKTTVLAHRHIYLTLVGPIPDGLQLDHLCRTRCCVNPAHLEPVTQAENIRRGESPSGRHARVTHCPFGHAYEGKNIMVVRKKDGTTNRRCAACHYRRHNARRRVRRAAIKAARSKAA